MSLLDILFHASKMLGNNLSTLPLNFSISVFQLHHILWTGTKLSSSSFWTSSKSSSKVFSPSLALGSTENASESLMALVSTGSLYFLSLFWQQFILVSSFFKLFLSYVQLDFFPHLIKSFLFIKVCYKTIRIKVTLSIASFIIIIVLNYYYYSNL